MGQEPLPQRGALAGSLRSERARRHRAAGNALTIGADFLLSAYRAPELRQAQGPPLAKWQNQQSS